MTTNIDINTFFPPPKHRTSPISESPAIKLGNALLAERSAPLLLPYKQTLMNEVINHASRLRDLIETKSISLLEPESSGNDHEDIGTDIKLKLLLLETELERIKFTARAYKRARLSKIERYPYYYLQIQPENAQMSKDEWIYCHKRAELRSDFFNNSFLHQFPEDLQDLTDTSGEVSMIDEPDADKCVCCALTPNASTEIITSGEDQIELEPGSLYFVRFSSLVNILDKVQIW